MLKRSFRLGKNEMDRIYKKGRSFARDFFVVRFTPNRAGHCRFAVVISKKVLAKAVDRNSTKRQVYLAIGDHQDLWQDQSFDIAFVFKKLGQGQMPANNIIIDTVTKILTELK